MAITVGLMVLLTPDTMHLQSFPDAIALGNDVSNTKSSGLISQYDRTYRYSCDDPSSLLVLATCLDDDSGCV
ncbi:hypothetical protein F1880_000227 [Penicillium rolfsii]|nr:hypothetical protein F1880_000227 [Penicillium rolfsii]